MGVLVSDPRIGADSAPVRARRPMPFAVAAVAAVVLGACDAQDGRELPAPDPRQTTTTAAVPEIGAPSTTPVAVGFTLSSPAFADGGELPARFTCTPDSAASPPLAWSGTPPAAELAVVVVDDTEGTPVWVLAGIDPASTGLDEGGVPETGVTNGWHPPCPAAGVSHTLTFTLHALAHPLGLVPGTSDVQARALIEAASTSSASLHAAVPSAG